MIEEISCLENILRRVGLPIPSNQSISTEMLKPKIDTYIFPSFLVYDKLKVKLKSMNQVN